MIYTTIFGLSIGNSPTQNDKVKSDCPSLEDFTDLHVIYNQSAQWKHANQGK